MNHGNAIHLGQVATRASVASGLDTTNFYTQTRSAHIFRAAASSVQIAIPCWYVTSSGSLVESSTGANCLVTAGIEYPVGTFTQVKFSGSASATITDGATLVSDAAAVSIPAGATAYVRIWMNNSAGVPFSRLLNSIVNDADHCSATSITDQTISGTVTTTGCTGGHLFTPIAVLANVTIPSICFFGDSRADGSADTLDSSGDVGNVERSIGPNFGYANLAQTGSRASDFNASHTLRAALVNSYCTHVIFETGVNDITGGFTVNQIETNFLAEYATFPSKKVFQSTIEPYAISTGTPCPGGTQFQTVGQQTAQGSGGGSFRISVNDWIRTTPTGLAGYFEVANSLENGQDGGVWAANGTGCRYTDGGLHENQAGYLQIQSANAIPSSAFTWP